MSCHEAQAVARLAEIGGRQVVAGGTVLAEVPCPVGGPLSDHDVPEVVVGVRRLRVAVADLGSTVPAAFMTLSFIGLTVIPDAQAVRSGGGRRGPLPAGAPGRRLRGRNG